MPVQAASTLLVWTAHQSEAIASCIVWIDPSAVGTSKQSNSEACFCWCLVYDKHMQSKLAEQR